MPADVAWLKHLAAASFREGAWRHADPEAVERLAQERLEQVIDALADLARDYAAAWSQLPVGGTEPARNSWQGDAVGHRMLKVLDLPPQPRQAERSSGGFMLLFGPCQLTVAGTGGGITATLVTVTGFTRHPRPLARLEPHIDPFGSIAWRVVSDDAAIPLLMQGELIIKMFIEAITRAAHDTDGIPALAQLP